MTWLDDYRRRLRAASSQAVTPSTPMGPTAADIAASLIASNKNPTGGSGGSGGSGGTADNFWDLAKNFEGATGLGGRALDVLSRGTYAMANPNYEAAKRGENTFAGAAFQSIFNPTNAQDSWSNLSNPIDDIRAAGRGFAGKDKTTFSDVLKEKGWEDGPGRVAAGFGLDVVADPLTWIPATWFAKGYGAVGKGISKATPAVVKPGRKTVAETVTKDTDQKLLDDLLKRQKESLDPNGKFIPADRDLRDEISAVGQPALPAGTLQNYSSYRSQPEGRFVAGERGTVFEPEGGFNSRDFTSLALSNEANEMLGAIPHTRKTSDMFRDNLAGMTDEIERVPTGVRTSYVRDPEVHVREKLVNRHLRDTPPETKLLIPEGITIPGVRGKQASKRKFGEWIGKAPNPAERTRRIEALDDAYRASAERLVATKPRAVENYRVRSMQNGKVGSTPIKQLLDEALDEAPAPRVHKRRTVLPYARKRDARGGNNVIGMDEYVDHLRDEVSGLRADPMNSNFEQIFEERVVGQTPYFNRARHAKGTEGLKNWREEMRIAGFNNDEINYLNRAANLGEGQYNAALARVNTKREGRFTLDELEAALKEGRVDKDDLTPLFERYNVKTIKGLKTKLTKLFNRESDTLAANQPSTTMEGGYQFGDWLDTEGLGTSFTQRARERSIETTPDDPWHNITDIADDVPTAEEFVEAATRTGDQVIEQNLATLPAESAAAVRENLQNLVKSEFLQPKLWKHSSNSGTLRTHKKMGDGYGRNIEGFNTYSQYSGSRGLLVSLNKHHPDWITTSNQQRVERYMAALKTQEETLKDYNINPILGTGKMGDPLSIHDTFEVLGPEFVAKHYINRNTALPITHLMSMVDILNNSFKKMRVDKAAGTPVDDIGTLRALLLSKAKEPLPPRKVNGKVPTRTLKSGKTVPVRGAENNFIKNAKAVTGAKSTKANAIDEYIAQEVIDPLIAAWPTLNRTIEKNLANVGLKVGESTKYITDEVVQKFANDLGSNDIATMIARVKNPRPDIAQAAKEINADNIPGIGIRSQDVIETSLADFVNTPGLYAAAKGADAHHSLDMAVPNRLPRNAKERSALINRHAAVNSTIGVNTQKQFDDLVKMFQDSSEEILDIGQQIEINMMGRLADLMVPHAGTAKLHEMLRSERIVSQADAMRYSRALHNVHKAYSPDQIRTAFHMVQNGQTSGLTGEMASVVAEVNKLTREVFDSGENALYGSMGRSGVTAVEMNKQFELKGMPKSFRFENNDVTSWTKWTVDDPLDFLSRAQNSLRTIQTYQTIGRDLGHKFAAKAPQPGYVRLTNKGGRESTLFDYIDHTNLYFPRDIADQILLMDRKLTEFMQPRSRNSFIRSYDTILHSLKAGFTIYRPGHHVRNRNGDLWMNFMDGVMNPVHYVNSFKMLSTARGKYADFDFRQALRGFGEEGTGAGKTVVTVKIGGKKRQITAEEAYNLMYRHGGLPDHSIIEDLSFNSPISGMEGMARTAGTGGEGQTMVERLSRVRPLGGKLNRAAVATSEVGEHYMRGAHFLSALKQTKARSHFPNGKKMTEAEVLDDMAIRANERVRKFHPDGSDITKFERDVMRRGVFFYSWIRKAVPLVLEMILMRPGKFMIYPKAMYNMAEGMGIDLQSMGNPFPTDQLFPDFLTESVQGPVIGEQGNYWGLKFGTPGVDVLDDFFHSPGKTVDTALESVVPFARVTGELGTRHRVGGIPIQDYSDYIGQQIPNATYADKAINSITGRSALAGFTQSRYDAKSNQGYEASNNPSFVNWLLGVGLTDMSKPSYIKNAEFDARDRARRESGQ